MRFSLLFSGVPEGRAPRQGGRGQGLNTSFHFTVQPLSLLLLCEKSHREEEEARKSKRVRMDIFRRRGMKKEETTARAS